MFFDQPRRDLTMTAEISDNEPYGGEVNLWLDLPKIKKDETVTFGVALSGTARLTRHYLSGVQRELSDGCPSMSVFNSDEIHVECREVELSGGTVPWAAGTGAVSVVVFATMEARRDAPIVFLTLLTDAGFSTESADSSYFQLPQIGSIYIPRDGRELAWIDVGDDRLI